MAQVLWQLSSTRTSQLMHRICALGRRPRCTSDTEAKHGAMGTAETFLIIWAKKAIFSFKNFREFPQVFSNSTEFPFWNSAVLAISIEPHCIVPLSPQWISFGLKIRCNGCNPATLFRVPWFSCFLVSFPLRFSSFSCPNFGTSHSHPNHLQVLPPIPAWPLVTRHFVLTNCLSPVTNQWRHPTAP